VLGSGSTGNCTLIATARTRLLVDAGLSRKEVRARLAAAGEPDSIDAILISHEHTDHVAGLPVLAKRLDVPVYMTRLTAPAICWAGYDPKLEAFQAGTRLVVGDIEVDTYTIPHDAIDPVGFCFRAQGVKIGLATDLGYIPESVKFHLRGTDLLVIESNHDTEMLKVGPYPWSVKQRVMGRKGHLSNDVVCEFLRRDLDTSTSTVVLAHLSEHNNHPAIVRLGAEQALERRALFTRLVIAGHRAPTEVFYY
jgi:phosphoribosyl 1,2-cyclic phosphodiesterase